MDPAPAMATAVARVFGGRRVVIAGGVLAGMDALVAELRAAGAERMLLAPMFPGTGPAPDGDVEVQLDAMSPEHVSGATATFRAEEQIFERPPQTLLDAIERFSDAPIVLAPAFSAVRALGPWPVYGSRRREWVALEDKTVSDALFDAASIARPPTIVVPAERDALIRAADALDRGDGTVWSGDAAEGFNGGAEFVRWVRDDDTVARAVEFFGTHCARVRVAPFVEGVPCSIHGMVIEQGVSVLRPAEMVVARVDDERGFRYAGAATYYDPPEDIRDAMRDAARRMGQCLRQKVGFRGAFTIDGIVGTDGWVATECNPRPGGGLNYSSKARRDLFLLLAQRLFVEGAIPDLDAAALEDAIVTAADAQRWGGAWTPTEASIDGNDSIGIVGDERGYRRAETDETPDATLEIGPSAIGGFVRFTPDPARTPIGPSIAPRGIAAFEFADREYGTGLGALRPAVSVR